VKTVGKFLSPLPLCNPDHSFIQMPFRGNSPPKITNPHAAIQEPDSVVWWAELTMRHILWPVTHVTHQSADPWPATRMTRDPWPSPKPWQESITTTYESWVHDCCLLFSAIWNSGYDLCNIRVSLVVYTAIVTSWTVWIVL